MEAEALESVLGRRAALQAALVANRAALQRAARKDRYVRMRAAQSWQLSVTERETVVMIYTMSGYAVAAAVVYLQDVCRKRKWHLKGKEELQALVEDLFLASEPRRVAELCDQEVPASPAAMRVAARYCVEGGLAEWVGHANQRQGVAPSTEAVLGELERRRLGLPEAIRFPSRGGPVENRARVWALQWRRRWGARHGTIRVREELSVAEMRSKVRFFV